ncbi:hypothetical protein SLE2022_113610 [Rubroshorea leprosula]
MVAAVSETINPKAQGLAAQPNSKRPPLLPSDPDNAINPRRPKSRDVSSRYLSTSSSTSSSSSMSSSSSVKRCPSPVVSRNGHSTAMATPMRAVPSAIKRSQSTERRRAVTPRSNSLDLRTVSKSNGELTEAQKLLFTSTRSLSVSFQGESFSIKVSKAKPAPSPSVARKGTPERRKQATTTPGRDGDQTENSKVERWPGSFRGSNSMNKSVDCTDDRRKLGGSGSSNVVRALQNSIDTQTSLDSRLSSASVNADKRKEEESAVQIVGSNSQCDPVVSDTESVSSGSTSGAQEGNCNGNGVGKPGGRLITVPASFWQESNSRFLRHSDPGSPVSKRTVAPAKLIAPKKVGLESPQSSLKGVANSRGQISPIRGPARPPSPNKLGPPLSPSPLRGLSPSRARNGVMGGLSSNVENTTSFLSFAADVKRGKVGENRIFDAHLLRLFHNRLLQWRFINAKADAALSAQRLTAEQSLHNAWISTSSLRESVRAKRIELQLLRQNLKLLSFLKGQMVYLEEWALLDGNFSSSLLGATEALRASTLRLPVVGGARTDIRKLNDAICSAIHVMQTMASSVCSLMSKVGEVNSLLVELENISANERALLDQCKDLLSSVAAMQVTECSLRTHILQLQRLPSA